MSATYEAGPQCRVFPAVRPQPAGTTRQPRVEGDHDGAGRLPRCLYQPVQIEKALLDAAALAHLWLRQSERQAAGLALDLQLALAVTHQLDQITREHDLVYPVYPGEYSASLGGNISTNAGGMRAVKYGVTRHHVLGLETVLPGGQVMRTGGKFVKASSGYDLTQLVIGSEGTLALVTEATLKLYPRAAHAATVLAPFTLASDAASAMPSSTRATSRSSTG